MKNKQTAYIKFPLLLIGFTLCICGVRWLIHDQPWILDQVANEERLQMSFVDLFLIEGNTTLSEYLTQIYRFLGLYVFGLGFFLLSFSTSKMLDIALVRKRVLTVLGLLLISNLALAYFWIPSSHFIYVIWATIVLYSFSLYNHINYSKREMAKDMIQLMDKLNFKKFFVAGHDRGGRVAHRMARDFRKKIEQYPLV